MKLEDLIPTDDICVHYRVEKQFIRALHENGIIEIQTIHRRDYISLKQITEFERVRRLYYDMNINMEGIEVVQNLLQKINDLQREKQMLLNRLRLYE